MPRQPKVTTASAETLEATSGLSATATRSSDLSNDRTKPAPPEHYRIPRKDYEILTEVARKYKALVAEANQVHAQLATATDQLNAQQRTITELTDQVRDALAELSQARIELAREQEAARRAISKAEISARSRLSTTPLGQSKNSSTIVATSAIAQPALNFDDKQIPNTLVGTSNIAQHGSPASPSGVVRPDEHLARLIVDNGDFDPSDPAEADFEIDQGIEPINPTTDLNDPEPTPIDGTVLDPRDHAAHRLMQQLRAATAAKSQSIDPPTQPARPPSTEVEIIAANEASVRPDPNAEPAEPIVLQEFDTHADQMRSRMQADQDKRDALLKANPLALLALSPFETIHHDYRAMYQRVLDALVTEDGRPLTRKDTLLTVDQVYYICMAIQYGATRKAACAMAGVTQNTFGKVKRAADKDQEPFRSIMWLIELAEGKHESTLVYSWTNSARTDWRAAEKLLQKRHKGDWSESDSDPVELTPDQIASMSREELRKIVVSAVPQASQLFLSDDASAVDDVEIDDLDAGLDD